jgi:hypothetical protein
MSRVLFVLEPRSQRYAGRAHGGPGWDVQIGSRHVNVFPGRHIDDVIKK